MPIMTPEIQVRTPAGEIEKTRSIPSGRGFYQLEEESLYLPIEYPGNQKRFYSYLESESISLHLDRAGRLLFIEVDIPRRRWNIKDNFVPPEVAQPVELRFLDFRKTLANPEVFCDHNRENLLILFDKHPAERNVYLADNLIAQVTSSGFLTAVWAFDFTDDMAGREIAFWRYSIHKSRLPEPQTV